MPRRPSREKSTAQVLTTFLEGKGREGATLQEIYFAVRSELGEDILHTTIRSDLYRRLVGAKGADREAFERFPLREETRYRILQNRW